MHMFAVVSKRPCANVGSLWKVAPGCTHAGRERGSLVSGRTSATSGLRCQSLSFVSFIAVAEGFGSERVYSLV